MPLTIGTELSGEYNELAEQEEVGHDIDDSRGVSVLDRCLSIKFSQSEIEEFTRSLELLKQELRSNKDSLRENQEESARLQDLLQENDKDLAKNKRAVQALQESFLKLSKERLRAEITPLNKKLENLRGLQQEILADKVKIEEFLALSPEERVNIADQILEIDELEDNILTEIADKVTASLKRSLKQHNLSLAQGDLEIVTLQEQISELSAKVDVLKLADMPESLKPQYESELRALKQKQRQLNKEGYKLNHKVEEAEAEIRLVSELIVQQEQGVKDAQMILRHQMGLGDPLDSGEGMAAELSEIMVAIEPLPILHVADKFEDFAEYERQVSSDLLLSTYSNDRVEGLKELSKKLDTIKDKFKAYYLAYQRATGDGRADACLFIETEVDPLIKELRSSPLYKTSIAPRLSDGITKNPYSLKTTLDIHKQVISQLGWEIEKLRGITTLSPMRPSLLIDELDDGSMLSVPPVIREYTGKNSLDLAEEYTEFDTLPGEKLSFLSDVEEEGDDDENYDGDRVISLSGIIGVVEEVPQATTEVVLEEVEEPEVAEASEIPQVITEVALEMAEVIEVPQATTEAVLEEVEANEDSEEAEVLSQDETLNTSDVSAEEVALGYLPEYEEVEVGDETDETNIGGYSTSSDEDEEYEVSGTDSDEVGSVASLYADEDIDDLMDSTEDDEENLTATKEVRYSSDEDESVGRSVDSGVSAGHASEAHDVEEDDDNVGSGVGATEEVLETSETITINVDPVRVRVFDALPTGNIGLSGSTSASIIRGFVGERTILEMPPKVYMAGESEVSGAEEAVIIFEGGPAEWIEGIERPILKIDNLPESEKEEVILEKSYKVAPYEENIAPEVQIVIKSQEGNRATMPLAAAGGQPPATVVVEQDKTLIEELLSIDEEMSLTEAAGEEVVEGDAGVGEVKVSTTFDKVVVRETSYSAVYTKPSEVNTKDLHMQNLKATDAAINSNVNSVVVGSNYRGAVMNNGRLEGELVSDGKNIAESLDSTSIFGANKFESENSERKSSMNRLFIEFYGFIRRKFEIWS